MKIMVLLVLVGLLVCEVIAQPSLDQAKLEQELDAKIAASINHMLESGMLKPEQL